MIKNKTQEQLGFTIVEIAIVLIVSGSLLAFLGSALLDYQQKRKAALTEYRLERIQDAISVYLTKKHKLPCPASMTAAPGSIDFGRERGRTGTPSAPPVAPDCRGASAALAGTRTVNGFSGAGGAVRYGSVPVRDLDLEDDIMVDGYGNRFTYAVTVNQATIAPPITYTLNGGDIDVVGVDGVTSILLTPGSADYVVISHGQDGQGARDNVGNIPYRCSNAASNLQKENCINQPPIDNDATFMSTMRRADGNYDDFVVYAAPSAQNIDVPTGAVVPFNLQSCPSGWGVLEDAQGRLVMGVVDNTFTVPNRNVNRTVYNPFDLGSIRLSNRTGNIIINSIKDNFRSSDVGNVIKARPGFRTKLPTTDPDYLPTMPAYGVATITSFINSRRVRASVSSNFTPATTFGSDPNRLLYSEWIMTDSGNSYPVGQTEATDPQNAVDRARYNVPPYVALLYCIKN